jgi:hypothetical protein
LSFARKLPYLAFKGRPLSTLKEKSCGSAIKLILTKEYMMAKYGKSAQRSVKRAMHKMKKGSLESGKSGKKVKSRKQAIAIGLSEARRKGAKVPAK